MAIYPTGASSDADLYTAVDNFSTTLSTLIDNVQTTISVNSVVGLPTVGILTIESEKVKYTGISGNDLTGVTRGFSATSAAPHALGSTVVFNMVEEHHNANKDEVIAIETDLIACKAALNDADTPASTSTDVKDRLDQIVSEIKRITGNANWYDTVGKNLTQVLPLSGGTMTGNIAMSGTQKLTGLAAGSTNGDSLRYEQLVGAYLALTGGTLSGALTLSGAPTSGLHATTRDYVDSKALPVGIIAMWSGSIISIPSGWHLCDGTGGTPDLRDRFIVGAGSTYAVNATGGSKDSIVVQHNHPASSVVTDPGHFHGIDSAVTGAGSRISQGTTSLGNINTGSKTTGITVATTTSNTGSSGTNANLPPYYALAYIMKV